MFSRNNKKTDASVSSGATVEKTAVPSILSADLKVVGNLISAGEVQIDGVIEGDIRSKVLLVGESAQIKGEIIADQVRIHGTVEGQIKARAVYLASTARVIGDILHHDLSIDKGAFVEGHITHMSEAQQSSLAPPSDTIAGNATVQPPASIAGPNSDRVSMVVNKSDASANKTQTTDASKPGFSSNVSVKK